MDFKIKLIFLFVCNVFINAGGRILTIRNKVNLMFKISGELKLEVFKLFRTAKKNIMNVFAKLINNTASSKQKFFSFWKPKKK